MWMWLAGAGAGYLWFTRWGGRDTATKVVGSIPGLSPEQRAKMLGAMGATYQWRDVPTPQQGVTKRTCMNMATGLKVDPKLCG